MRYTGPLGKSFEGDKQHAMSLQSRARVVVGRLLYALKRQGGFGQQYGTERQDDGSVIHAMVMRLIDGQQPLIRTWIESPVYDGYSSRTTRALSYPIGFIFIPVRITNSRIELEYGTNYFARFTEWDVFMGSFDAPHSYECDTRAFGNAKMAWEIGTNDSNCAWIVGGTNESIKVTPWVPANFGNVYWAGTNDFDVLSWRGKIITEPQRLFRPANTESPGMGYDFRNKHRGVIFHKLQVLYSTFRIENGSPAGKSNIHEYVQPDNEYFYENAIVLGAAINHTDGVPKLIVALRATYGFSEITVFSYGLNVVETEGITHYEVLYSTESLLGQLNLPGYRVGVVTVDRVNFNAGGTRFCARAEVASEVINYISFDIDSKVFTVSSTGSCSPSVNEGDCSAFYTSTPFYEADGTIYARYCDPLHDIYVSFGRDNEYNETYIYNVRVEGHDVSGSITDVGNIYNCREPFLQVQAARSGDMVAYSLPGAFGMYDGAPFVQPVNLSRIGNSTNPNRDILGVDDNRIFLGMLSRV